MIRRVLTICLALLWVFPAAGQDNDKPTIAILRFGSLASLDIAEGAILDLLESYDFISADENRILEERRDYQGEHVNIIWGDAGFDFPTISVMLDDALDHEADVLVTLGTPVTLAAVKATLDLDAPPAVLFTAVHNPFEAGIAAAACIKPAHVTGMEIVTSYDFVFEKLQEQDPDLAVIGTIFDTAEASGVYGVDRIRDIAGEMGISVETAGVTSLGDLRPAAAGLVQKGAQAIVLPIDSLTTQGLPIIVAIANENGIPIFHPSLGSIYYGATIGAGYSSFYQNGVNVGRTLAFHLNGDIDIATTGIHVATGRGLGVNLDSANLQGLEVSDELLNAADVVLEGGVPTRVSIRTLQRIQQRGVVIPQERRLEADREFFASLQCSPEMIAEQQAQLEAADS